MLRSILTTLPATAALALAASTSAQAQIVGGVWQTPYQFEGEGAGDEFGRAVAALGDVSGDGIPDLGIGALYCDSGGLTNAGSAWVRSGADGTIIYRFDGLAAYDELGTSIAGAGDVNGDGRLDVIVGAPKAMAGTVVAAGQAYIYSGLDGSLLRTHSGAYRYGLFGFSVSTVGDLNMDGKAEVVVGEPYGEPNGYYRGGAAYVFDGATGSEVYRWEAPMDGWTFGNAVAAAGDVNGDGTPDIIIGSTFADVYPGGHDNAGLAVVYSGATGQELWHIRGQEMMDMMGNAVAGVGDVNHDGLDDVVVGAYLVAVNSKAGAGAAYLLSGTGTLLVRWEGRRTWERNGWSLSNAGDVDGDGTNDILSGAYSADTDTGLPDGGKVYLYSGRTYETLHVFQGQATMDRMGYSVAGTGDLDGDSVPEQMMGAHLADVGPSVDAGRAYVQSFKRLISGSEDQISSAAGGTVDIFVDFPASEANRSYAVLASATGTGPTRLGGIDIPLSPDALYQMMRSSNPPPFMRDPYGVLDAAGDAMPGVVCPPGGMVPLIGRTMFVAAVSYTPPTVVHMSTVALPIQILP